MAVVKQLRAFLNKNKVKYQVKRHPEAYTAQEVAHSEHVPGRFLAKTVVLKVDGKLGLAVLPANLLVDLDRFKKLTRAKKVELAKEGEFEDLFPGCEVGAMPPFGSLYNLRVAVDKSLTEDEYIVFNAGTHRDTVKMSYQTFAKLEKPMVADFGRLAVLCGKKQVKDDYKETKK